MSVFNLGVVFGPTLLRPQEESVAAILDIKFNNIVINILIENYERIFKNEPGTTLLNTSASPPTRTPRANQLAKTHVSGGNGTPRSTMYSPQQQVYRVVTKSNYTEPSMSSSLQNIPNGLIYSHNTSGGSNNTTNGGGGGAHLGGTVTHANGAPGAKNLNVGGNMGSIKNLHSMSQSDISVRRGGTNSAAESVYGIVSGTNGTAGLSSHHATPATASSLRHEFLMATATPAATSGGGGGSNHIYASPAAANSGSRMNMNNVSPPTLAMRTEALYGTSSVLTGAVQQHARTNAPGNHMSYAQAKHYSSVAAASTSSSNESVCDSLSSTNGGGGGGSIGRLLNARGSLDYAAHASQASSLSTLLGSNCEDVVTATAAPSMIGVGAHSPNETDYAPQKVHRNKDVSQIKRDLSSGTA